MPLFQKQWVNVYRRHSKPLADESLWLELKGGNKSAFRILFLRHYDSLYQYGLTITSNEPLVEDCLQELFYKLWEQRKTMAEVQKVKGYLWISFRRRLMTRLNKKRSRITGLGGELKIQDSAERRMIRGEQDQKNHRILKRLMNKLSRSEREVLHLKYYQGMSYEEIEKILDIEYQTARNYMYRAISRLREALESEKIKIVLTFAGMTILCTTSVI